MSYNSRYVPAFEPSYTLWEARDKASVSMETDDGLRGRIRYVAGDSPNLETARGLDLDRIAGRLHLKRREIRTEPKEFSRQYLRQYLGKDVLW